MRKSFKKFLLLSAAVLSFMIVPDSAAQGAGGSLTLFLSSEQENYYGPGIEEFRQKYPEVELIIESYSINEMMSSQHKVKTELMAGKGPDLLLLDAYGTDDVYKLLKAGVFAPLDEFMTDEAGWDGGQYVMPVIDGGKFAGVQYVMPLTYRVPLVLSSQEALDEIGFNMDACQDTGSLLKEVSALYEKDHQNRILLGMAGFMAFPQLLEGDFLDYESESIDIDPQVLQEACESYKNLYEEDRTDSLSELAYYGYGVDILDREGFIAVITDIDIMLMPVTAIAAKETPVILPAGFAGEGAVAQVASYTGIRANSENKENAWNMLKILMGEEMQTAVSENTISVPVLKSVQDKKIQTRLQLSLEEAEDYGLPAADPGEEFLAKYREYLASPGKTIFINNTCTVNFYNTMLPFYEGQSDYESCLQEFESYIKIYLSE